LLTADCDVVLQSASNPDASTVYVDLRALRNDRVTLVEKGSPHSLCLMESGKVAPTHVLSLTYSSYRSCIHTP